MGTVHLVDAKGIPFNTNIHNIYDEQEIRYKLEHLDPWDEGKLCQLYEEMIQRGPWRDKVKLSSLPEMDPIYKGHPNFSDVLDRVKRGLALCLDSNDGLELTPILLVGPPGVGKTYFAQKISELFGTGFGFISVSTTTAGWVLSGASSTWRGAKPGKVFEILVRGHFANPVVVIDEIDKTSKDPQFDPLGPFLSLFEPGTSKKFKDEFADIDIDASKILWFITANDEKSLPAPILSRMDIFEIKKPTKEHNRTIAQNLYLTILGEHDWGKGFDEELKESTIDCLSDIEPRKMRQDLLWALGDAKLGKRSFVLPEDLPKGKERGRRMGF